MEVKLTRITEDPVLAIEEAASNCYDSNPSSEGKIMSSCISSGHTSVTEFCNFTFHITGVSRSLLAQLTRHRHAGYAVRSQRYCNEDNFGYVIPHTIENNLEALNIYNAFMEDTQIIYNQLQQLGIPNEDARYILPNGCETVIEMTINLRSLMNFMNERLCTRAQWEIRELALKMKQVIVAQEPKFAKYLVPKCEKYGEAYSFCPERKSCGRHSSIKEVFSKSFT